MSTPRNSKAGYRELSAQLEAVLEQLQQPGIDIDEAVRLYKEGLALAAALEKHLAQAENSITTLQAQESQRDV